MPMRVKTATKTSNNKIKYDCILRP